jgi:hypothetical protein
VLTAHVELPFNQFHYDVDTDFSTTQDADEVLIVKPRTDDARNAYRILQHAINRTSGILKLPLINENGVLDATTFRALFAIANSPAVVTKAQPLITDLTRGMAYDSFVMLGPFRTPLVGPALISHINKSLLDLAERARLWGSLLSALADAIWWSTDASNNPPVPGSRTTKLPMIITAVIGLVAGIGIGALLFRRRARHADVLGAARKSPSTPPAHYTPRQTLHWWHRKVVAAQRHWQAEIARSDIESPKARALQSELDRLEYERDDASAYASSDDD